MATAENEIQHWRQRARKANLTDETKALECVRRMSISQQQQQQRAADLNQARQLQEKIRKDLQDMETKLRELRLRQTCFVTRQARAQVDLSSVDTGSMGATPESVFERWERNILVQESRSCFAPNGTTDRFEESFQREEEEIRLRELLQQIIEEPSQRNNGEKPE
jgi:phage shock protein A